MVADGKSDLAAAAAAASDEEENVNETQSLKSKRSIKLTHKALVEKVEKLQNVRKDKLSKVKNLRKVAQELKQSGNAKDVKCTLKKLFICVGKQKLHMNLWCI